MINVWPQAAASTHTLSRARVRVRTYTCEHRVEEKSFVSPTLVDVAVHSFSHTNPHRRLCEWRVCAVYTSDDLNSR